MPVTDLEMWLVQSTDGASPRDISKHVPYSYSSITRWIRQDNMPCEAVIQIARAYRASILEGLVAAGWIDRDDAESASLRESVRQAPSTFLTDELSRRIKLYEPNVPSLRDEDSIHS